MLPYKITWTKKGYAWTKRDKSLILIKKMSNKEVLNVISMLDKKIKKYRGSTVPLRGLWFMTIFRDEALKRGISKPDKE